MVKRAVFLFFIILISIVQLYSQVNISGTVKRAKNQDVLSGALVVINDSIETITGGDGTYVLSCPEGEKFIFFSYPEMQSQKIEIKNRNIINCEMYERLQGKNKEVVTALGIYRQHKSLGYAVQDLPAHVLENITSETNAINALEGRVAGMFISSSSGGLSNSVHINIRGTNSITGNNQPLYILDGIPVDNSNFSVLDAKANIEKGNNQIRGLGGYDMGNMIQDINPEDIESISILKGPSASALYGSRAANGVIVISTKTGKSRESGLGIEFNTGLYFEKVAVLPKYQNKYGGGNKSSFDTLNLNGIDYLIPQWGIDESWGPELNGQQVLAWHNVYDYEQGITDRLETSKWESNPDNIINFFETGMALRTSLAISGGSAMNNYRLSYSNLDRSGVFPNSKIERHTLSFSWVKRAIDKLTISAKLHFVNNYTRAVAASGYGDNSIMQMFGQWGQRQWNMDEMENYINPDGTQRSWNRISLNNPTPHYADNPYWIQHMNYPETWRNRILGYSKVTFKPTNYFSIEGSVSEDFYVYRMTERIAEYSQVMSYFSESIREVGEINYNLMAKYNSRFKDKLFISALIGTSGMFRKYNRNIGETAGGLSVPGLYSLENSKDPVIQNDFESRERINSLLGAINCDYKGWLYFDITFRNDWSSTLPTDNSSYFYHSETMSFIFSRFIHSLPFFDFGKIRLGRAHVGNDTDPYQLSTTYIPQPGYGGYPSFSVPANYNNAGLKPENTISWETGVDLRFFEERLNFDLTYYYAKTTDQIFALEMSAASGYQSRNINAGNVQNIGIEIFSLLKIINTPDIKWNIGLNWARNKNKVVELFGGVKNIELNNLRGVSFSVVEGKPYGILRGNDYQRDERGRPVVDENGYLLSSAEIKDLGCVVPDWTGGIQNTISYKNLTLSFLIDMQKGGNMFSVTNMFGYSTGVFEESAGNNDKGKPLRDPVDEGGGFRYADAVVGYVDEDNNLIVTSETNDKYIPYNETAFDPFKNKSMSIFSTDYYKLREVSLTYNLPERIVENTFIEGLSISFVGRNMLLWGEKIPHIDPEQASNSGNIQGLEGAANPATRTYGFKLKISF